MESQHQLNGQEPGLGVTTDVGMELYWRHAGEGGSNGTLPSTVLEAVEDRLAFVEEHVSNPIPIVTALASISTAISILRNAGQ